MMRPADRSGKAPVLVLGCIPRIVTAIARSLHRHGVPVDVATLSLEPQIRSRAVRQFKLLPSPQFFPQDFISQLKAFIQQNGHDMLIPADDQALVALMEHYEELEQLLRVACPAPPILRQVLDKSLTLEVAKRCGIRIPETVLVTNPIQFRDAFARLPLGCIAKPAQKSLREEQRKNCVIDSVEAIGRFFPRDHGCWSPLLLQEFCPGTGVGIEIFMHNGDAIAVFQHRRLKELPFNGGFAVTAIAEIPDPELVRSSVALLHALQWEGVAMVEFKVDGLGQATLMEVNGRYWGTLGLPIAAGLDFPLYQWKLLHGETPEIPRAFAVGTKWRWTAGYARRLHELLRAARHSSKAREILRVTLASMPGDFAPATHDAVFTVSDPIPAIAELARTCKDLLGYFADDIRDVFRRARRVFAPRDMERWEIPPS